MADQQEDALVTVHLRRDFYRDSYRKVVSLLIFSVLIVLILSGGLFYVVTHPPKPQYFATTVNGRIMPLVPLQEPNLSTSALLQWANTAAIAAYTYNFVDYRAALQRASEYFTPEGWSAFMTALKNSNDLNALISKKLIVSAVATGAPVVLARGLLEGRYAWRIQMPMLVTYQSASEFSQQTLLITMLVIRVSTFDSPRGIGINQFVATPLSSTTGSALS
jgi:intracellular multiplication protein IcmL